MTSVYLIKAGETKNYKIGISDNPQSRLSNIQTSHYEKLSIIKSVEYESRFIALSVEEFLHKRYKEFNTLGEWFIFNDSQIEEIQNYLELGVTEVIYLQARIKELEQQLKEVKAKPVESKKEIKTKKDIIKALYREGRVKKGDKLVSKGRVVDLSSWKDSKQLTELYRSLEEQGIIEYAGAGRNGGYYAKADYETALNYWNEQYN